MKLAPELKADLLSVNRRPKAVQRIADCGLTHAQVVQLVQDTYRDANLPVPTLADIDWWLDDGVDP